jgi:hypothetical protein
VPFSTLVLLGVLAGSSAFTFALMWGVSRLGAFDDPTVQGRRPARMGRLIAVPLGPDDDLAFLRELRRRIDLGHFRH